MKLLKNVVLLPLMTLLAVAAGCSKSPTEPSGGVPATPKPPAPVVTYNITVTANPGQLTAGGVTPSSINVQVSRADNGQPPPDLTPLTLTTSNGEFGSVGSGVKTLNLQLVHGQAQAVLFPGQTAGTATVTAAASGNTGVTNVLIQQAGAFFISSVNPGVGSPQGGDIVTINGGGFVAPVRVTFGGAPATVRSVTPNKIVVVVPSAVAAGVPTVQPGQTVPVTVTVTINVNQGAAQAVDALTNGFLYTLSTGGTQQPAVLSVSPASGPNDGGTPVTIVGQGFQAPIQVLFGAGSDANNFNGVEATVQSVTPTQLVVLTPAARGLGQNNVNALVDILVKNLNSGFFTVSPKAFKYGSSVLITSWAPGTALYNVPETVTIFGQGFEQPAAVGLAGIAAQVLSVTGTEIVVKSGTFVPTGCQDLVGPISEVNINTGNGDSRGTFTYRVPKPQILSIVSIGGPTPTSVSQNGGTVTITGLNLAPNTRVTFGNVAGTVTGFVSGNGVGADQLTVTVPPFNGTFPTQACTVGNQAGTQKLPASVDVTVIIPVTTCQDIFPQSLAFVPNDQTCVIPPPPPPTAPVASFTATPVNGHTMQFADTSTGSPTTWLWDFGDGSPVTAANSVQNPAHTYAAAGNFSVKLTVSNSAGSNQTVKVVAVP